MNSQGKMWLKIWGALALVFALGCVTGIAINGIYSAQSGAAQPASMRDTDAYFERLRRDLDLNEEQTAAVRGVLEETRNEYRTVCAEVRPRYDALRERARVKMRAMLSADQQKRFDSIVLQEDCSTCPDRRK
ncbi:MAG TPA: hypothetical protein VNO70_25945 [Blastocatellia bacterium]|nr:hypothetical protein [Blastocatellia bacterium]